MFWVCFRDLPWCDCVGVVWRCVCVYDERREEESETEKDRKRETERERVRERKRDIERARRSESAERSIFRTLARLARLCTRINTSVETWRRLCVRYPHTLMEKQFHHHLSWPISDGWLGTPPHPRLPPLHHP